MNNNPTQKKWIISIALFVLGLFLFGNHISTLINPYFDETHYVPAAKQWMSFAPTMNLEHPPVGKYLIAFGMKIFGESPLGFRSMTVLFGALTLPLFFIIADLLFADIVLASLVSLFSAFNFWIFVQSRIAMLDIFMITFSLIAIAAFLVFRSQQSKPYFILSGLFWGLAVATKWSSAFILAGFLVVYACEHYLNYLRVLNLNPRASEQLRHQLKTLIHLGLFSIGAYFVMFIPYTLISTQYHRSLFEIVFKLPGEMLHLQKLVTQDHPYKSSWDTWPIMTRPIWYTYEKVINGPGLVHAVVLLGNPFQMAMGFLCAIVTGLFAFCGWYFDIQSIIPSKKTLGITTIFAFSWLVWSFSSRSITFFYYFFPSALCYSFLIPAFLRSYFKERNVLVIMTALVLISLGYFIYFYPVISGTPIDETTLSKWMWFDSWI